MRALSRARALLGCFAALGPGRRIGKALAALVSLLMVGMVAAINLAVPAPVISAALFARFRSRQEESFGAKVNAALRNEFGGHAVKAAEATT